MFAVLLDTCTLWPSLRRDFLLSLAAEGMYRPLWSDAILEELEYHEAKKLARCGLAKAAAESRAAHLVARMREAFDDAVVTGWRGLEGSYGLPDPDDEHVVAAAIVGGAGAIVTENAKDFPARLLPEGLDVVDPRVFAADTVSLDPRRALSAVNHLVKRSGRKGPPLSVESVLLQLEDRYKMVQAVELLRQAGAPGSPIHTP